MRYKILCIMILATFWGNIFSNSVNTPKRKYFAKKVVNAPIIDGKLDDDIWQKVDWTENFTEREPDPGTPPSEETKFKILYDEDYLYIAVRAYDSNPELISRRICGRDDFGTDFVEVNIDSYHDQRTAFSFTSSTCGSQGDEYISGNGNGWDESWNPVWFNGSHIDSKGWTTEYKIPFSQLRYSDNEDQVWGIQVSRRIHRHDEKSFWQAFPKQAPWVSSFGELHGLKGMKKSSSLELIPYNVWEIDRYKNNPDNKLKDGKDGEIKFGMDGKFRVTNNLTATFTINPDFGQVEADPANLNLSAFETFQWERRPFFGESNDIFNYYCTSAMFGGYYSMDQLFYSRRIGRLPQGYYNRSYDDAPSNTTILAAVKLSGKLENGMNIGILESVTKREKAEWYDGDDLNKEVIEPRTNYFVNRFSQNFNGERTNIGGIITSVVREDKYADNLYLNRTAHTGGLDFQHRWDDNAYGIFGTFVASHITGSKETILDEQNSSSRYFQRPDADHLKVDSNKTSLTGFGGYFKMRKSQGNFVWENGATFRSPELALNDIGYLRSADVIAGWTYMGLRTLKPTGNFKFLSVNYNHRFIYNSDFEFESAEFNINTHNSLKNNWSFGVEGEFDPESFSFSELEGGPKLRKEWGLSGNFYIKSPGNTQYQYGVGGWSGYGPYNSDKEFGGWCFFNIKLNEKIRININPEYETDTEGDTYYDQRILDNKTEYLFAKLNQDWWRLKVSVNYIFTPQLSFKLFVSPYIVSGHYSNFKLIDDADNANRNKRFKSITSSTLEDFGFDNEQSADFNYLSFQGNAVLKWEFLPGSTMYLVWTHDRSDYKYEHRSLDPIKDIDNIFNIYPDDIFLLKVSYWFQK